MQTDAYEEYFSRPRNKISMAVWSVLILNNPFSTASYLGVLIFDLTITIIAVISLYSHVTSLPAYSPAIMSAIDYSDPTAVAVVVIAITVATWFTMATLGVLIFKRFSSKIYSEKRLSFQILAGSTIIFRGPLYGIIILYTLHSIFSFNLIDNIYLKYISIVCSLLNCGMLAIYTYVGSFLYNLSIPNDLLPWADTSNLLCLFRAFFKFSIVLTLKFRDQNLILTYFLALVATCACGYRLFMMLFKAQIMNETVLNLTVVIEFAILHFMLGFLFTAVYQGESSYLLFVSAFLPVTCIGGLYYKYRARRDWLSRLMNNTMDNENQILHSYLYLIQLCLNEHDIQMHKDMVVLEKMHCTQCEVYFERIQQKMQFYYELVKLKKQSGIDFDLSEDKLKDEDYLQKISDTHSLHQRSMSKGQYKALSSTTGYAINNSPEGKSFHSGGIMVTNDIPPNGYLQRGHDFARESAKKDIKSSGIEIEQLTRGEVGGKITIHPSFGIHDKIAESANDLDAAIAPNPNDLSVDFYHLHNVFSSTTREDEITNSVMKKQTSRLKNNHPPVVVVPKLALFIGSSNNNNTSSGKKKDSNTSSAGAGDGTTTHATSLPKQSSHKRGKLSNYGKISGKQQESRITSINDIFKQSQKSMTSGLKSDSSNKRKGLTITGPKVELKGPNIIEFFRESKEDQLKKFAMHFFNYHLAEYPHLGFLIKLLKVFFSFRILNNPYLAHFLLFQVSQEEDETEDILTLNQKLINQRYIESIISKKEEQEEEATRAQKTMMGQVDLKAMLQVNQLIVEFDNSLEKVTDQIHDFWENLLNNRDIRNIFDQGYKISENMQILNKLTVEIESKQSLGETKVYLQMAQFYNQVIFKQNESYNMYEKARLAYQAKKLSKIRDDRDDGATGGLSSGSQEKCLIMSEINLSRPMRINFANKSACRAAQYSLDEITKLNINHLMPRAISLAHQSFIDEFMLSGQARFLSSSRDMFIKSKSGAVVPVHAFVQINSMSRKHMILIFDELPHYMPFDDGVVDGGPETFILSNMEHDLMEIANNFYTVTGISPYSYRGFIDRCDRTLQLDDLIKVKNYDCEVSQLQELFDTTEAEVQFKGVQMEHLNNQPMSAGNVVKASAITSNSGILQNKIMAQLKITSQGNNDFNFLNGKNGEASMHSAQEQYPTFKMKLIDLQFLGGRFEMRIVAFRRLVSSKFSYHEMSNGIPQMTGNLSQMGQHIRKQLQSQLMDSESEFAIDSLYAQQQLMMINTHDNNYNLSASDMEGESLNNDFFDIGSQSSVGSCVNMSSTSQQILSTYAQQVSQDVTPKTLNIILKLVLLIVVTMIGASILVLSLASSNIMFATTSMSKSQHTMEAVGSLTTIRLLLRSITNIELGYLNRSSDFILDRTLMYEEVIKVLNDKLREDSSELESVINVYGDEYKNIPSTFISSKGVQYQMVQTLSKGINLLATKVQSLLADPDLSLLLSKSTYPYFNLEAKLMKNNNFQYDMNLIERDLFFILNNSNGQLFDELVEFGPEYVETQISDIEIKLQYLSGISIAVCSLILLSALAVVPLFGKIQNRVLELMKLFFQIDNDVKKSVVSRIESFQGHYFSNQKKRRVIANEILDDSNMIQGGKQNVNKEDFIEKLKKKKQNQKKQKLQKQLDLEEQEDQPTIFSAAGKKVAQISSSMQMREEEFKHNSNSKVMNSAFGMTRKSDRGGDEILNRKKTDLKKIVVGGRSKIYKANDIENIEEVDEDAYVEKKESETKLNRQESDTVSNRKDESHDDLDEDPRTLKQIQLDNEEEQRKLEEQLKEKEKEYMADFIKYIKKRKLAQSILIVMMLVLMSSYFVIMYLINNQLYTHIYNSVTDVNLIFHRLSCSFNVINEFSEAYYKDNVFQQAQSSSLDSQIEKCLIIEKKYLQTILGGLDSPYLDSVRNSIYSFENGEFCNNVTSDGIICEKMSEQIRKQGLSTYYFNIIRTAQQMELELQTQYRKGMLNVTGMSDIINRKIAQYIDTLVMIVLPVQNQIQTDTINSIEGYYLDQKKILTLIFSCYMAVTIIFALFFFASAYIKLRVEMLQSNRLLYIIDFESIKESQRSVIHNFLLKF